MSRRTNEQLARQEAADVVARAVSNAANERALAASEAADTVAKAAATAAMTASDIRYIQKDVAEIKDTLHEMAGQYVSQEAFAPIRNLVYGMVAIILTAVVGGLLALIIQK